MKKEMIMKKVLAGLCVAATMITVSGAALAADNSFYGAVDIGQAKLKDACVGIPAGVSCDDTDTAYRLAGGYNFNKNFGAEISYTDYGNVTASATGFAVSAGATAFQIVGTGALPLGNQFSLTAKAGLAAVNVDESVTLLGFTASASANNTNFVWGIGAQFDVTPSIGIRVNYEDLGTVGDNATTGTGKLSNVSAGVVFKF